MNDDKGCPKILDPIERMRTSSPGSPTQIDFIKNGFLFLVTQSSQLHKGQLLISRSCGRPHQIPQIDIYLLSIAGGSSRNVFFVGVNAPLAPPGQVLARVMFCQHWTIFSTLSRFPRDASARVGTGWSLVCAASQ